MPTQTATRKPAKSQPVRTGCYLYAVIDQGENKTFGPWGLDGGLVYALGDGRLAAVVSDLPNTRIRPERRRLAAHHDVLKRLQKDYTVLPMVFGLIADGAEAIRKILGLNRTAFVPQLHRVQGKVEMGLHVNWDVPNIFEFFVVNQPELRQLRDQLFLGGREPSQNDKIELGRTFDRLLAEERAAHTARVTTVLGQSCFEIKENKMRNEREVMNLACLIGKHAQKDFENAVFKAAGFFDNHYSFDFNGPWLPHNFVEVNLQMP